MNDLEWCLAHKVNRFLFLKNVAHCFRKMEIIKALLMETCFQHGVLISDWYQILKPTYVSKALFNFTVISVFD